MKVCNLPAICFAFAVKLFRAQITPKYPPIVLCFIKLLYSIACAGGPEKRDDAAMRADVVAVCRSPVESLRRSGWPTELLLGLAQQKLE